MKKKKWIYKKTKSFLKNLRKLGETSNPEFIDHVKAINRRIEYAASLDLASLQNDPLIRNQMGFPDIFEMDVLPKNIYAISAKVPQFMDADEKYVIHFLVTDKKYVIIEIEHVLSA